MALNNARLSMILIVLLITATLRCAQAQEAPVKHEVWDVDPYKNRVIDPEVEAYFKQKAINDQEVSKCRRLRYQPPERS
jgi:hypothetical protein